MKKLMLLAVLLAGMVLVQGCGELFIKPEINTSRAYDVSYNELWNATVKTFAKYALPIQTIERESGIITTFPMVIIDSSIGSKQLDALAVRPSIPFGIWTTMIVEITAFVQKEPVQIKIITTVNCYESNFSKAWHLCYSVGDIELNMLDAVEKNIISK